MSLCICSIGIHVVCKASSWFALFVQKGEHSMEFYDIQFDSFTNKVHTVHAIYHVQCSLFNVHTVLHILTILIHKTTSKTVWCFIAFKRVFMEILSIPPNENDNNNNSTKENTQTIFRFAVELEEGHRATKMSNRNKKQMITEKRKNNMLTNRFSVYCIRWVLLTRPLFPIGCHDHLRFHRLRPFTFMHL